MISISIAKQLSREKKLDINIELEQGTFLGLSGPSGSGKTSLLRVIAGLDEAKGSVVVQGAYWLGGSKPCTIQHRDVGAVFQDYSLFPNMSVIENLLFFNDDIVLANKLLKMTSIIDLKRAYPSDISGGEQQRVALCRAMINRPKLLLLDEPLSALDTKTRFEIQSVIRLMHDEFGATTIMTSHDKSELHRLSDRVLTIDNGVVVSDEISSPESELTGELLELISIDDEEYAIILVDNKKVKVRMQT